MLATIRYKNRLSRFSVKKKKKLSSTLELELM